MIVREVSPPPGQRPREALVAIVLQALDIPWLKERGDLTIRDDLVYAGGNAIAKIIFDRPGIGS